MRKNNIIWMIAIVLIALLIFYKITEPPRSEQPFLEFTDEIPKVENRSISNEDINLSRRNGITNSIEKVQPAVVSVNVIKTQIVRRRMSFFFNFYDEIPYNIKAIGSGVIFSQNGHVITNAHVVEGATEIKVILTDNRQFDGKIIGVDEVHDIAVLKIDGENLPYAKLGSSADLIIGEWVIALGNPYGFLIKDSKPSVAVGVVSATNRDFAENKEGKIYRHMIQTDAAINQGNSGGPLVNILGEVIGINTFIFSESGGSIGIGFSIPIDSVKKVTQELIKYGKMRDIWFGFKVQDINPMLASHFGFEDLDGVIVNNVQQNSPAYSAGLRKLDKIVKINGNKIFNSSDAELAVSDISVDDRIELEVIREGQPLKFILTAIEYK